MRSTRTQPALMFAAVRRMRNNLPDESDEARISPTLVQWFGCYAGAYVRRNFHQVRLLQSGIPQSATGLPLVIYLNHAAWWDPLVCLLLAQRFFETRASYAPIDAQALGRYRILSRLGLFPVERNLTGARDFLRQTDRVLRRSDGALWITPQGHFRDVRERPVQFAPGLAHLAFRVSCTAFMPLAIEYVLWEERLPEILISFGQPLLVRQDHRLSTTETTQLFESALTSVQDHLSAAAQRRDPREWTTLLRGREGVGGVYEIWSRARAKLRGEKYQPAHSSL